MKIQKTLPITLLMLWSATAMASSDLPTVIDDAPLDVTSILATPDDSSPVAMCCDKWHGGTLRAGDTFYPVIQKGVRKKTRKEVGDGTGFSSEEAAQAAADKAATEENNK